MTDDPEPDPRDGVFTTAGGLLVAGFGLLLALSAAGVVTPSSGEVRDAERWPLGLFGAGVIAGGFRLVYTGVRDFLTAIGPSKHLLPVRFILFLARRVRGRTCLAASPFLLLAADYLLAWRIRPAPFWVDAAWLVHLMTIEFFLLHSTPILGVIVAIRPGGNSSLTRRLGIHGLRLALFGGMATVYAASVGGSAGRAGVLAFFYLTGARFLPLWLNRYGTNEKFAFVLRWFLNLILYVALANLIGPTWERSAALPFGFAYFSALGALDLFDLFTFLSTPDDGGRRRDAGDKKAPAR